MGSCNYLLLQIFRYLRNKQQFFSKRFVFGDGSEGKLGNSKEEIQRYPVLLMRDDRIKTISAGISHSVILRDNGEIETLWKMILSFGLNFIILSLII